MHLTHPLIGKIVDQLYPTKDSNPLPPTQPTEIKNDLETFFNITAEEAKLITQILTHFHFELSDLTLFELLGFDLFDKITTIESLIRTDCSKIKVSFQAIWYRFIQEPAENSQTLIGLLENLTIDLIRHHDTGTKTKEPAATDLLAVRSFQDRKKQECLEIIKTFRPLTILFIQLVKRKEQRAQFIKVPLKTLIKLDQNLVAIDQSTGIDFLQNLAKYTWFIFACTIQADPSIEKDCDQMMNEFCSILHFAFDGAFLYSDEINKLNLLYDRIRAILEERAQFFNHTLSRIVKVFSDNLTALTHTAASKKQQELVDVLLGTQEIQDSSLSLFESDDILIGFKRSGLVDSDFSLSKEEQELVRSLYREYPLDSHMTLWDLLSFALIEKIGDLKKLVSFSKHGALENIQYEISSWCYLLFVGFRRADSNITSILGPATTEDAERYHYSPKKFLSYLDASLDRLETELIPKAKSHKTTILVEKCKKRLQEEIVKTITPIRVLWHTFLKSEQCFSLLILALSNYYRLEIKGEKTERSFEVIANFIRFHQMTLQHGAGNKYFQKFIDLKQLPKLTSRSKRKDFERFAQTIAKMSLEMSFVRKKASKLFQDALDDKVTQRSLIVAQGTRMGSEKSQACFREMCHGHLIFADFCSALLSDILRLTEKRILPKGTPKTESSFFRLVNNVNFFRYETKKEYSTLPLLERIIQPLHAFFESPPFITFTNFIDTDPAIISSTFLYPDWLVRLKPLTNELELHLNETLTSLKRLPEDLKDFLFNSSLEELQAMKAEDIRKELFQGGVRLLQPIQILIDGLTILQKRRFYEEAAIIPPELANIMDLEGIEELLQSAIQSKAPPEMPVHQVAESIEPRNIEEDSIQIKKVEEIPSTKQAAVKKTMPQTQNRVLKAAKTVVPSSTENLKETKSEFYDEIVDLTKSRKILKKLEEMGYVTSRTNGSHFILKNEGGNTVVVPKNDNLPYGTRQSIAEQATQNPKEKSDQ